jgi:hypothetical protein
LFLVTLFFLGIIWGGIGVNFGVPYLFWAEDGWIQFLAAIGATWLLGKLCFIGYLLSASAAWMKYPSGELRSLRWYLLVTWLPLLVFGLVLRAFIPAHGNDSFVKAFNDASYVAFLLKHIPFALGVVVGAIGAALLVVLFQKLPMWFILVRLLHAAPLKEMVPLDLRHNLKQNTRTVEPAQLRDRIPPLVRLHALAGSFFVLLLSIYVALVLLHWTYGMVTPALALCILLGLVADIYGFIRFWWPAAVNPVLAILILLAIAANVLPDKHRFFDLEKYYGTARQPFNTESYEKRRRQDCGLLQGSVLEQWLAYYREHQASAKNDRPKIVVVAVSGGGIRAAYWTAMVLNNLERDQPGFFYKIRLITGASGGMLGAAHFTAKLDELKKFDVDHKFGPSESANPELLQSRQDFLEDLRIVKNLEHGGLDTVAQYWVLQDVPRFFCPLPYSKDRGWALEEAWRKNLHGALDCTFHSLSPGEKEGWRPSMVFSPMIVEDGRRLLISNLDLDPLTRTYGNLLTKEGVQRGLFSVSAVEFFRLFPGANNFKLSTAVRMNASFPYVSPAGALPTDPTRHVVDAGYYDNFGIEVAASWIFENRQWIAKNSSGVVLIQIRDAVEETRQELGQEESPVWWQRGLAEGTTPLMGGVNALEASMSYRNDEQLRVISDLLTKGGSRVDGFTTLVIECPVKAELNWSLTKKEITAIQKAIEGQIPDSLREILNEDYKGFDRIQQQNLDRVKRLKKLLKSQ